MKRLCILITVVLLTFSLPALAVTNPVVPMEGPAQIFEASGLIVPIPYYVDSASYSIIGGTIAQAEFAYNDARFTLRLAKTPEPEDISGVYDRFEMSDWYMEDYEGLETFACKSGFDDQNRELALWYDQSRGISGSMYVENVLNSAEGEIEQVLYSLARGVCVSGEAICSNGSFSLRYPVMLTEEPERTEKINHTLAQAADTICAGHDGGSTFEQQYCTYDYYLGRMTIEWAGWTTAPGAAYSPFEIASVTVDLSTGDLKPLREQIDTAKFAALLKANYREYYVIADFDNNDVNSAQREYFGAFTLEDWKALLDNADFPCDGWPSAFTRWSHDEYETCLLLSIPVSHALGDQASFGVIVE